MTSSWFFLSTLNYDARSTTHQMYFYCTWVPQTFGFSHKLSTGIQEFEDHVRTSAAQPLVGQSLSCNAIQGRGRTRLGVQMTSAYLLKKHPSMICQARSELCDATDVSRVRHQTWNTAWSSTFHSADAVMQFCNVTTNPRILTHSLTHPILCHLTVHLKLCIMNSENTKRKVPLDPALCFLNYI